MPARPLPERYVWLPGRNVYRSQETGRYVAWGTVRGDLEHYIDAKEMQVRTLTESLQEGRISVAEWQQGMRITIKDMHANAAMIAKGGRAQMTPSDWGLLGALVKTQYRYLDRFAAQIANGSQRLDGTLAQRAAMYADAPRSTHQEFRRRLLQQSGQAAEERRVLGVAEHCPDCLEYAGRGWQPLGTLPPIGDSRCRTHCQCYFDFRTTPIGSRP